MRHITKFFLFLLLLQACKQGGGGQKNLFGTNLSENQTQSGVKYQFYTQNKGRNPKEGDLISFHLVIQNDKNEVLQTTYGKYKQAIKELPFEVPYFIGKPYFKDVFELTAEGDSLSFWINADSLADKSGFLQTPKISKGTNIQYTVKILKIRTKEEIKQELKKNLSVQREIDKKLIREHISTLQKKDKNLKIDSTATGLHYYFEKIGQGKMPANGDTITINYVSKLLDGTIFGGSETATEFLVGHITPTGLEEGVALMQAGSKGVFILPSELGFGEKGMGSVIPPNSILVFDVELLKIK